MEQKVLFAGYSSGDLSSRGWWSVLSELTVGLPVALH